MGSWPGFEAGSAGVTAAAAAAVAVVVVVVQCSGLYFGCYSRTKKHWCEKTTNLQAEIIKRAVSKTRKTS